MEIESIRPVLSGLVGGLLAIVLCHGLSRWTPESCSGKSVERLMRENRVAIWLANGFFFAGIVAGIYIYHVGLLPEDDWRGLALGVGGGSVLALGVLFTMPLAKGNRPKEAVVAYAASQKSPAILIYGVLSFCSASFAVAVTSLLLFR